MSDELMTNLIDELKEAKLYGYSQTQIVDQLRNIPIRFIFKRTHLGYTMDKKAYLWLTQVLGWNISRHWLDIKTRKKIKRDLQRSPRLKKNIVLLKKLVRSHALYYQLDGRLYASTIITADAFRELICDIYNTDNPQGRINVYTNYRTYREIL